MKHLHEPEEEMLQEYDLSGKKGVRGKYYQAYRQGHIVRIHQEDGSVTTQHFMPEDGAIVLAPKTELIDEAFVGMWRDRDDLKGSSNWVRQVRQSELPIILPSHSTL